MPSEMPMSPSDSPATHAAAQSIVMSDLDPHGGPKPDAAARPLAAIANADNLVHALRNVKVNVTVCIGSAELTVGELLGARAQQVLPLDRHVDQPVDVLVEGQVVARGMLVAVEERFGVRITELPVALPIPGVL
jgi:flagellar motor switch protein FliN/FliY